MMFLRIRSGRWRKISLRSVRLWKGRIDSDKLIGLVTILERRGHGLEGDWHSVEVVEAEFQVD